MKAVALRILIVLALIPVSLQASISEDMVNQNLTLADVINNARADGLSMNSIVTQMLGIAPDQSSAIQTTAIVLSPEDLQEIIQACIDAGIAPSTVLAVAMIAAPDSQAEILAAVTRAAPEQTAQLTALSGLFIQPETDSGTSGAGGGSGFSALDYENLFAEQQATLNSLDLSEEVIAEINAEMQKAQTALENVNAAIAAGQDPSVALAELEDVLSGIDDAIGSYAGGASTN